MNPPLSFNLPNVWQKMALLAGFSVTLYDYLLMFDDEVKYVWEGRKSLSWSDYSYDAQKELTNE